MRAPLVGAAAGVHEDHSAASFGADGWECGVPREAGDVVDDFCACGESGAGGGGFIGIDGEHCVRLRFEDAGQNGQQASLFFF